VNELSGYVLDKNHTLKAYYLQEYEKILVVDKDYKPPITILQSEKF